MPTVFGYVKVKETNEPVPDLVVSVYDWDPSHANWLQGSTQSLGSTITDERGRFELKFEVQDFAAADPEGRPDLVVAVFAPSTTLSLDRPTPQPPAERLLHYTQVPRVNAGNSEAFVIRLLVEQLHKFAIRSPTSKPIASPEESATRLVDADRDNARFHEVLRNGLAASRRNRVEHRRAIAKAARDFAAPLGSTSMKTRSQRAYLSSDDDFEETVLHAIEDGLGHLGEANRPAGLEFFLTDDDLHGVGLTPPTGIGTFLDVDHEQLCALLAGKRGGPDLVRVRGLLEARRAAAKAEAELHDATTDTNGGSTPVEGENGSEPIDNADPAEEVNRRILGQIHDMRTRNGQPDHVPAATADEISAALTGFRLGAGPTDTPAFHDFHRLQIAFKHVWTEAFDSHLRGDVEDIYAGLVELHEEYHEEDREFTFDLPTELNEIEELNSFLSRAERQIGQIADNVPPAVQRFFGAGINEYSWNSLSWTQRRELEAIAHEMEPLSLSDTRRGDLLMQGSSIIANPKSTQSRLIRLLKETAARLSEPYAFHYFAPNTVNFGILQTYRQLWEPLDYQVGELVATIPLAPGETRKFTAKRTVKRTRAEKELEKAQSSRSGESTITQRADAVIVEKASLTSNFKMTAEGSVNFGIGSASATTEFARNQAQESSSVKKNFREAVVKASQEYKQERSVQVVTTDEVTSETTTSGEISNPNNELTVTYLFCELERQYRISERIHRVTPVVLVAQDVPGPHEITESWLLAHEWILRRVLLDDSLRPGLDYLTNSFAGDEVSIGIRKANWTKQSELVTILEATVDTHLSSRNALRKDMEQTELDRVEANNRGFLENFVAILDSSAADPEMLEANREALKAQLGYLAETLAASQDRLSRAVEALNEATRAYTGALESQTNRRVAIDQLRVHVKENILYYMQAIWDHEPPDQRFFRLYHQPVILPEGPGRRCRLRLATDADIASGVPTIERIGRRYVLEDCDPPLPPLPGGTITKTLVEIADLDRPLGYKGNYIIFPLKTCLYLTEFMMHEYMDDYFGVRDPDEVGNFTTEELLGYVESIWHDDEEASLTEGERNALREMVLTRLRRPTRDSDIVVVPTGELFIEALLGTHPLLEDFKRIHRGYDVAKVRAELREAELENLRRAARLLEGERDDPDIDKLITVEGNTGVTVDPG